MNKYTLYLPLFFALFALAGCEKEHTGYLFTEYPRYPIESLNNISYEDYTSSGMSLPSADAIAVAAVIGAPAFFAFPSGPAF